MHGKNSKCKQCIGAYYAGLYRRKSEKIIAATKAYKRRSPRNLLAKARKRALERCPTPNAITTAQLYQLWEQQQGRCPLTGYRLTWAGGKITETSLSLDRIDHNRGYCLGNVRLVCYAVNAFRGRMSDRQMIEMAKAIVATMDRPQPHYLLSEAA